MTLQSHFHSTNMQLFYTYYTCKVCTFRHLIGSFEILQTSPGRSARTIFFSTHKITLLTSKTTQLFSYLDVLIHYSRFFILRYMSRNISFFCAQLAIFNLSRLSLRLVSSPFFLVHFVFILQ